MTAQTTETERPPIEVAAESASFVRARLETIRVACVRRRLLHLMSRVMLLMLGWLGGVMLMDAILGMSYGLRVIACAGAMLLIGRVLAREAWPMWRSPMDSEDAALLVESCLEASSSSIISAEQFLTSFGRGSVSASRFESASRVLMGQTIEHAARLLRGVSISSVVDPVPARRWLIGMVIGVLAFGFATIVAGEAGIRFLKRALLMPGVDRPTATRIELLTPANHAVVRGDRIVIDVRASGVIPARGRLRVETINPRERLGDSGEGGRLEKARAKRLGGVQIDLLPVPESPGLFRAMIPKAIDSIRYAVELNDATSEGHVVEVVIPPEPREVTWTEIPPAYTRRAPARLPRGELSILAGSRLEVKIKSDAGVDLEASRLVELPSGREHRLTALADRSVGLSAQVGSSALIEPYEKTVSIRLILRDARGFSSLEPYEIQLRQEVDAAPTVTLQTGSGVLEGGNERWVTPWASPRVMGLARDDVGLASMRLRFVRSGSMKDREMRGDGLWLRYFNDSAPGAVALEMKGVLPAMNAEASPGAGVEADQFFARYEGWLHVTESGRYEFRVEVDDRVTVRVGDTFVWDLSYNWGRADSRSLELRAGLHPIRIDLREETGRAGLRMSWRRPGDKDFTSVPRDVLFSSCESIESARAEVAESVEMFVDAGEGEVSLEEMREHRFELSPLTLAPGDRMEWWIEATDLAGATTRSAMQTMLVGTEEQVRAALLGRLGDYMNEIDELERRQAELADEVGQAIEGASSGGNERRSGDVEVGPAGERSR